MQWFKMSLSGLQMEVLHIFIMPILILSWLFALFGSSFAIVLSMSSSVILTENNLLFVLQDKVGGSWLLLLIKEHRFAKNELNSSVFFKSVIYSLISKQRWDTWNFFANKETFQNRPISLRTSYPYQILQLTIKYEFSKALVLPNI